jgi:predicted ATPase/DNA-binding winged helix-turn-helix (wHTH) protein
MSAMSDERAFLFGPYRLIVGLRELVADGEPVALGSRAFDLLVALAARAGQVVTKDELMAEAWPGVVVEDNNLTTQISAVRRALNDGIGGHRYIMTVPGRGYRFVAPVELCYQQTGTPDRQQPVGPAAHHTIFAFFCAEIDDALSKWRSHPDAMQAALPRFEMLIRDIVQAHRGDLYRPTGDALRAAFATVEEAAAAAMAAQRALAKADWIQTGGLAIAMAIHVGSAVRRGGEYHGLAVTRAARLAAVAHGGQVVLSAGAAGLMREHLSPALQLLDLGECRPDASAPAERVYQLAIDGQCTDFPPLRWLEAMPHNLPRPATAIIGREIELAALADLTAQHRIVTLGGMGGLGKTRMALELGHQLLARFPDGVWFVSLERLNLPELVAETIAGIFGLKPQNMPAAEAVIAFLRQKKLLLIFDNAEHLIAEIAALADAIVKRSPFVRVVATSREVLGVPGEHVYRVPALDGPDRSAGLTATRALRYAAIRLFVERAGSAPGEFALTDETAPIVAEICRRLDGNALAIELAAARLKLLAPRELLARLEDRFSVLAGGSRLALPRQQTLRATIDWSYNLLPEDERILLRRLSVFGGSFLIDSAVAVAAGAPITGDVLDLIGNLIDKSLVVPEAGGGSRLRLLESTRAYAAEALSGPEAAASHRRLTEHLVALFSRADEECETTSTTAWRGRYGPEIDNLRAALHWAFGPDGNTDLGAALVAYGFYLWMELSLIDERQRWLALALPRIGPKTPPAIAARLHLGLLPRGTTGIRSRRAAAERGVELARQAGEPTQLARALVRAATTIMGADTLAEATVLFQEAILLVRPSGKTRQLAAALNGLAAAYTVAGDFGAAQPLYEESAAIAHELGMSAILIGILNNRAEIACAMGDLPAAVALARRALGAALEGGDRLRASLIYDNLSAYHLLRGETEAAASAAAEALSEAPALGEPFLAADAIQALALVAARSGDPARAARLLGYVDAVYAADEKSREATETAVHQLLLIELDAALPAAERETLRAEGAGWTEEQAAAAALAGLDVEGMRIPHPLD